MEGRSGAARRIRACGMLLAFGLVAAVLAGQARAQVEAPAGRPLDDELRAAIIDSVAAALNEHYVFKDTAAAMEKRLRQRERKHEYDDLVTVEDFASALTEDLLDVSHDRHIGAAYFSDDEIRQFEEGREDPAVARERAIARARRTNYQFRKAEILEGNVGYLRLDNFLDTSLSGPTATAAMNFLGNVDAIIFDLRYNGGGSPSLIQYITAYLVDEPTHLNNFATRGGDSTQQFWSAPFVPGPKLTEADAFVLTSDRTFSGAEEFSYNLKNLGRATIVGDTTGGGAHPVSLVAFPSLNLGLRVPYARAVNPITGTNWEGTGVTPDIAVPADDALDVAYTEALRRIAARTEDPDERAALEWSIAGLDARRNAVVVDEATLKGYAGSYGPRRLFVEDGRLLYQREGRPAAAAIPMSQTLFRFEEYDYFRLEVVLDESGHPTRLIGHYNDGHTDESARTEAE